MKKVYNAIFKKEETGYFVRFPDIPEAITEGETLEEAYEMAFDVLGLMLQNEKGVFEYPKASAPSDIKLEDDEVLAMIYFDEIEYLRKTNNAAVKKTLTIPEWLNTMAINANINFSQTLQEALKAKLNI